MKKLILFLVLGAFTFAVALPSVEQANAAPITKPLLVKAKGKAKAKKAKKKHRKGGGRKKL